jgi:hypothetical protein
VLADGALRAEVGEQQVDEHTDGAYTVLPLQLACAARPRAAKLNRLHAVRRHRPAAPRAAQPGGQGAPRTAILGPQAPSRTFDLPSASRWRSSWTTCARGVWHIWIGFDHILFLLSLLLPAVGTWALWRPPHGAGSRWSVSRGLLGRAAHRHRVHRGALDHAVAGHAGLVAAVALVESAIAASVVLAALNNVWPLFHGRRWMVAFVFGLVHGFGFASVLADLGLPQGALALALVGFNVGVEVGQLAIVLVFLPLAFALRRTWFYRRAVLVGGSLVIAAIAAAWLAERAFECRCCRSDGLRAGASAAVLVPAPAPRR